MSCAAPGVPAHSPGTVSGMWAWHSLLTALRSALKLALEKRTQVETHSAPFYKLMLSQTIIADLESHSCMCFVNMALVPEGGQAGP